ncbi:hypothetical protein NM208_g11271 [Fusarium decemcellulare]|uniref:Uncharacterized protein n=1 Tax=Fusarium decemcellulare TaxID=57161 RepID=A0ACC1RUZ5_9HYPO|nr:hypothetical protein NM208_g11271 [Fusarium decemcellulare]
MAASGVDCSKLKELDDFSNYIDTVESQTQFVTSKLQTCKAEICNAVYGTGNPDISGIGVAAGYILELALGVVLSLAVIFLRHQHKKGRGSEWNKIFTSGLRVFFDSAAYFALALQLATIVVLVRKDYGISTDGLGAIEARIAQSVAVVSMMPLLYPVALLEPDPDPDSSADDVRHNARLLLLSSTVSLSFYPFLSRCIHAFGQSPIGNRKDSDVTPDDWGKVALMCFPGSFKDLTKSTTWKALPGLELTASLITYLFTFWLLAGLPSISHAPRGNGKGQKRPKESLSSRERVKKWFGDRLLVAILPLVVIFSLAVPLLVVIFRLRKLQEDLSENMGEEYEGQNWGFGQIVSIVLFFPVVVEMAYRWRFGDACGEGD